jgi:FeS assembly protein IscX
MKLIQMSIRSGFALQTYMLGCALPDFSDDPTKSTEGLLEAIQMAWIDEAR